MRWYTPLLLLLLVGCTDNGVVLPGAVNCSDHEGVFRTMEMQDGSGMYWIFCGDGYVYWSYGYS